MTFAMKMMEERKEGRKEGRREGQRDERVAILHRLIAKSGIPVDQALDMIGIPVKEHTAYKKMLRARS